MTCVSLSSRNIPVLLFVLWASVSLGSSIVVAEESVDYFPPLTRSAPEISRVEQSLITAVTTAGARLVAVGEHGIVALSDDNGNHWHQAKVPVDVNLTGVKFADQQTGWAIGHFGVVLGTQDAGETWTLLMTGTQAAQLIAAWANNNKEASSDFTAYAEGLLSDGPDKPFFDILVKDKNNLVVIGAYNLAIQSNNGGRTWQALSQTIDNSGSMHLYALTDMGGREMIAGEQGLLLSQDGSGKFTQVQSPYDGSFFGLLATGEKRAVIFGLRGNAYFTVDNGKSWTRSNIKTIDTFNAGMVKKNGEVLLLTQSGRIFTSQDSGANFRQLKFEVSVPLTGAVEAENGNVIIASVAGVLKLPGVASREFVN